MADWIKGERDFTISVRTPLRSSAFRQSLISCTTTESESLGLGLGLGLDDFSRLLLYLCCALIFYSTSYLKMAESYDIHLPRDLNCTSLQSIFFAFVCFPAWWRTCRNETCSAPTSPLLAGETCEKNSAISIKDLLLWICLRWVSSRFQCRCYWPRHERTLSSASMPNPMALLDVFTTSWFTGHCGNRRARRDWHRARDGSQCWASNGGVVWMLLEFRLPIHVDCSQYA